eukprot:scaffold3254_cov98-Cylindrotheca_fusiformis.AAC.4
MTGRRFSTWSIAFQTIHVFLSVVVSRSVEWQPVNSIMHCTLRQQPMDCPGIGSIDCRSANSTILHFVTFFCTTLY